jgi:gamma-glutamylcyclotransferase (GGCT)/AIG2-like uncharacterized protein YtfP
MSTLRAPAKTDSENYIFVYGTLRSSPGHEMNRVLKRYGNRVGRGRLHGTLYDVGRYPGAVRRSGTRAFVWGDVYDLRDPDRALKILDRYEGLSENDSESAEFRRSRATVDLGPGRRVHAWIYLYNRSTTGLTRIRSGDYLDYLNQPRGTRPRGRVAAKSGS